MSMINQEVCDLYNIPNDDHKKFRLDKFVEYQHEVPATDFRFVCEFIDLFHLNKDEIVYIFWLLSCTYSEITSVFLFVFFKNYKIGYTDFWECYKNQINIGSARKWVKNKDLFPDLMNDFDKITNKKYFIWVKQFVKTDPIETYKNIHKNLETIKNCKRFASDLFLQVFVHRPDYFGFKTVQPIELDWENCDNLTSGIYNIFYQDKKANDFDVYGKVSSKDKKWLTEKLKEIQNRIIELYPDEDPSIYNFVTKICSFRNLFKNARYAGFHHDRELGVIIEYQKNFPEFSSLWKICYEIRKRIFQHRFLGELNGWYGIRKERKKLWLKYGLTGAEK